MLENIRARRAAAPASLRALSVALATLDRTAARGRGKPWTGGRLPTEKQRDELQQWADWFYDVKLGPDSLPRKTLQRKAWSGLAKKFYEHADHAKPIQDCGCRTRIKRAAAQVYYLVGITPLPS